LRLISWFIVGLIAGWLTGENKARSGKGVPSDIIDLVFGLVGVFTVISGTLGRKDIRGR
jgi:uncharacterized membrane protein YeaQ/YmgE (transglycosylase-associated protein family)